MKKFTFANENTGTVWMFDILTDLDKYSADELDELVDHLLYDSHSPVDLEVKYGIHDIAGDPEDDLLGFMSYEIEEDKFPELMEIWKNIFKSNGLETSEVYKQ